MDELFLVEDVAKILRLNPYTIRKKIREGTIKAIKVGRTWRVSKSEVERLMSGGV